MNRNPSRSALSVLAFVALLVSRGPAGGATNPPPRELTLVAWNVENLFDAEDDPQNKGDDPFTPRGWEFWTEERYRLKLDHLASLLAQMGGDLVCLSEVENRRVLEDLNAALAARGVEPYAHILHREGADERGIDVAMLSRYEPAAARWLSPVPTQRDILIAQFLIGGQPLTVLANHWKSHYGRKAESDAMRRAEAEAARAAMDELLRANRHAAVALAGDFNDDVATPTLLEGALATPDLAAVLADPSGRLLFNLHGTLPPGTGGTIYYRKGKFWNSFDSICVSRAMVDERGKGWRVKQGTYEIVRDPRHVDPQGYPLPFRRSRDPEDNDPARRAYITGYSDHFPVRVVLTLDGR